MAKIRFVNDIFSTDVQEGIVNGGISVQTLIDESPLAEGMLADLVKTIEVYNAETGETSFVTEKAEDFNAVVFVNGEETDAEYIISDADVVSVFFVPASAENDQQKAGIQTALVGALLALAGAIVVWFNPVAGGILLSVGIGLVVTGLAVKDVGDKKALNSNPTTSSSDDTSLSSEALLSIAGGSCQNIVGQRIPFVMGKHLVNPLIVGSPYHETRTGSWYGYTDNGQYYRALYCVGYGTLKLTDFKIENTYLAYNQSKNGITRNTAMHGALTTCTSGDTGDILYKWKNNDIRLEILQKGSLATVDEDKWGTIYNETVEELNVNANVLHVQDEGIFSELISKVYKGISIPNGYRTNTVKFARNCPYKIEVELDLPSSLYKTRSTPDGTRYVFLPVCVAVQWRYVDSSRTSSDATSPDGWTDFTGMKMYNDGAWSYNTNAKMPYTTPVTVPSIGNVSISACEVLANPGIDTTHTWTDVTPSDIGNGGWATTCTDADGNTVTPQVFSLSPALAEISSVYTASQFENYVNEGRLVFDYEFTDAQIEKIINYNGNTSSEFDSVEVRVVRLTPAYLDQTSTAEDGYSQWTCQDLVKWTYLRTWSFDKEKWIEARENGLEITSSSYLIQNYPLRPIREEDLDKMCFVALSLKQDVAETGGSSLGNFSLIAESFCPKYDDENDVWTPAEINKTYKYYIIPDDESEDMEEVTEEEYEAYSGSKKKVNNGNDFVSQIKSEIFGEGSSTSTIERHNLTDEVAEKYISNNTASVALLSLVGGHLGKYAKTYDAVDLPSFAELYNFCEDVTDGSTKNEVLQHFTYCCNGVVSSEKKLETLLQEILATGRASLCLSEEAKYKAVIGKENPYPVTVLNTKNCLSASNVRSFDDVPSGFQITFIDETDGYNTNDLYIMDDQESASNPSGDIEQFNINYVTDRYQLWSLARYNLAARIQQREIYTRKVGYLGLTLAYGDTVLLQDETLLIGTDRGGRISKLLATDELIYGFILDDIYELTAELDDDDKSVHGVTVVQPEKFGTSRCVTLRLMIPTDSTGVTIDDEYYPYRVGKTNIVLFESPVVIDSERLQDTSSELQFSLVKPSVGNIVAIGKIGAITTKAIITNIKPSKDSTFELTLAPYNESLYNAGAVIPDFQSNMTIPNWESNELELKEGYSMFSLKEQQNSTASAAISTETSQIPSDVTDLTAVAKENGIRIDYSVTSTVEIAEVIAQINRGDDVWEDITVNNNFYTFDRSVDGYPEASELDTWTIRIKVKNVYGNESENYVSSTIDTDSYGTWTLSAPSVTARVQDRTIFLTLSEVTTASSTRYGDIRYRVSVKRYDDTDYYTPATTENPYPETSTTVTVYSSDGETFYSDEEMTVEVTIPDNAKVIETTTENEYYYIEYESGNEENYKASDAEVDGYVISSGSYNQTMPLEGQKYNNLKNTSYSFKVVAYNESGNVSEATEISETALCTNIRDIVMANETAKSAFIETLSAITANIGVVTGGALGDSDSNHIALSTFVDENNNQWYKGDVFFGDSEQYFKVTPNVEDGEITDYTIELKANNISLTSSGLDFTSGTYIYDTNNTNLRLALSAGGITIQETSDSWSTYDVLGKVYIDEYSNLIITNAEDSSPLIGFTVEGASVYRFNKAVPNYDENGVNSQSIVLDTSVATTEDSYLSDCNVFPDNITTADITSSNTTVVAVSKADKIKVGDTYLSTDGTTEGTYNSLASTDWGLTSTQVANRIFSEDL